MAHTISHNFLLSPFSSSFQLPSSSFYHKLRSPAFYSFRASSSSDTHMELQGDQRPSFKDFPYVLPPIKDLMLDLVSTLETRLESQLLPCTLPQDIQYFHNQTETSHGSLFLRSGANSSPIDFILGSWLHCELPNGAAINITTLVSYMNDSTDSPQFLIEFIQSSPTSLVMLLDLPARRDLVPHPDYLKTFYEDTGLDKQRQLLLKIPEIQAYISSSLYIRSLWSPTAAVVQLDTTATGGESRMEEILKNNVSAAAKEVLRVWLEACVFGEVRDIGDDDRVRLKTRDRVFKQKSIEIDLGANLPRMFGKEIADRVMGVLLGI